MKKMHENTRYFFTASAFIANFILLIGLLGCADQKAARKKQFNEKWQAKAEDSRGYSPVGSKHSVRLPDVQKAPTAETLSETESQRAPAKPLPKNKISMNMHDAPVGVLLRALARAADVNLMVSSEVQGNININVQSAPWDQVFLGILETRGLTYSWKGDIIRIITVEDMEHDLKVEEIREKQNARRMGLRQVEPLLTRIINIDYTDATKIKDNLEQFLTKDKDGKPRGAVLVDEHTNSIIIKAIGQDIAAMMPLINRLDRATPQILIEANIIETTRDTARQLGIQWGGLYHGSSSDQNMWATPGANTGGAIGNSINTGIDPTTGWAADFVPQALATATSGFTVGFVLESIGDYLLNVQLSALEEEGKLNILSTPSLVTLDNQTAFTENGEKIPYVSTDEEGNREVKFEDAVLRLEIKPHVIDGNYLRMDITVIKDDVDTTRSVDGNPFIIKKETQTTLIVENKETIVISGLSRERNLDSENGVPALKDAPLLGNLFRSTDKSQLMEEVLIFITPHILEKKMASGG